MLRLYPRTIKSESLGGRPRYQDYFLCNQVIETSCYMPLSFEVVCREALL